VSGPVSACLIGASGAPAQQFVYGGGSCSSSRTTRSSSAA